ncbi:MAG TPA: hydrogenase accessory protein HypB [Chloroflexi bacterium]|nr:hydrogenase accessory protein HypB [Chloroflexota bacterium]
MKVPVVKSILAANDQIAQENRQLFDEKGVMAVNIMASPGAGKTSLILRTIERLRDKARIGVIEGDVASSIDADRIAQEGVPVVQINTGGGCHLDANMLRAALPSLNLDELDILFIENVGNLICPANFRLGAHIQAMLASIPEGDDKPYKYPGMYQGVDALVVNKIDLLPYVRFDMERFRKGVAALNPDVAIFEVSCVTGKGVQDWAEWLMQKKDTLLRRG